ncbi:uncharacterized protein EI90DRAFT_3111361, partial [Cantharellus anzutake]|uniref:uncharacterized protein n=1 Tax=Cantharellus anzutake TaxID=1750568 RepID=UPI001905CB69
MHFVTLWNLVHLFIIGDLNSHSRFWKIVMVVDRKRNVICRDSDNHVTSNKDELDDLAL